MGIEKETALLVLDVLDFLQKKHISLKDGYNCFIKIEYALNQKIRERLSEDFRDMLNEAIILDEIGTKFGPDLKLLMKLATKVLTEKSISGINRFKVPTVI